MTKPARIPPHDLDAEENVLGSILLRPGALDEAAEEITGRDFYRLSHGRMFDVAVAMRNEGRPVDAITLSDELDRLGEFGKELSRERVHELAAIIPATSNARHYAQIVREMSLLRALIRAGTQIAVTSYDRADVATELIDRAEQAVFDIARSTDRGEPISLRETVPEAYRQLEELYAGGSNIVGVPSGFKAIDHLTSGFQPGNLVIVAARPSMGKSALALGMASHVVLKQELPVALFSLEMSRSEVTQRLISSEGALESRKLRTGQLNGDEWSNVQHAAARLQQAPLYIDDQTSITMAEIRSRARRLKLRHPTLALVVVDYIQLMTADGNIESRVQQISQISRSLKILARELEVPVVALSQLSRQTEGRHDHRPILSDLRESGAIEQDADIVMFVYRDEYYHPEDTDQAGLAEINLAKHRNGETATIKLAFQKRYARFLDLAQDPATT